MSLGENEDVGKYRGRRVLLFDGFVAVEATITVELGSAAMEKGGGGRRTLCVA
jgi:hypothetical protein